VSFPRLALALVSLPIFLVPAAADRARPGSPGSYFSGGTIHLVQVAHTDLGWIKSPAEDAARDVSLLESALDLMTADSAFKFSWEDMAGFEEFLKLKPGRAIELKERVREGRLTFGATYTQPYQSLLSSEQMARQLYFGRKWFRREFPGLDTVCAFDFDVPQRALQMSQLLRKAGVKYLATSRTYNSVPGRPNDGFFEWSSPDGSAVLNWTQYHYYAHTELEVGIQNIKDFVDSWEPYYSLRGLPKQLIYLLSEDYRKPKTYGAEIAEWNAWAAENGYPLLRYSTMDEALESQAGGIGRFDKTSGERPNLWLYEAAPDNHRAVGYQKEAGFLLPAAEAFATFRSLEEGSFDSYPAAELDKAWGEAVWACHGWQHEPTVQGFIDAYQNARDGGRKILDTSLGWLARHVKTGGRGTPLVVFNALSWPRTDPVTCAIPKGVSEPFLLNDSSGKVVPCQVLPGDRMVFVAENLPSFGYRTYHLVPGGNSGPKGLVVGDAWSTPFENDFYRITPARGGLESVFDKRLEKVVLGSSEAKVAEIVDLFSPGQGAGEFTSFPHPASTGSVPMRDLAGPWTRVESGPVRTSFEFAAQTSHARFRMKIVVYNAIKRVDFEPSIIDWDGSPDREFRLFFPLDKSLRNITYDVPFGISGIGESEVDPDAFGWGIRHQPREVGNWMSAAGRAFAVTIASSVPVIDYMDPPSGLLTRLAIQPILLATRTGCGWGEKWTQTGTHDYRFGLLSHDPESRDGRLFGAQFNNPPIAVFPDSRASGARLPESAGYCSVSPANIVISAIKKADDDDSVVVRFYETEGIDRNECRLAFLSGLSGAARASLVEEAFGAIPVAGKSLTLPVGHHSIETIRLRFKGLAGRVKAKPR
jgi:alpha-mannosidase